MARKEKIVIQSRLGEQSIDKSKVIYFPKGIIGFEDKRKFVLLQIRPGAPLLILQSIDDPELGLLVADPYSFIPDYKVKVGDAEQSMLCLDSPSEASVLVTVSIPQGKPHLTSLNLTGPILVHSQKMIGMQVPQADAHPTHVLLESLVPGPMPKPASAPINLDSQKDESLKEDKGCIKNSGNSDIPLQPCEVISQEVTATEDSKKSTSKEAHSVIKETSLEKPKRKPCRKKVVDKA